MEGVFYQLDPRLRVRVNHDLDDIEAEKNVGIVEQPEPGQAAARNPPAFLFVDCDQRAAEIFARPRFHLDEHEGVAVARHNVDLAAAVPAEIAVKNFIAVPAQKAPRQFLAEDAPPDVRGR